MPLLVALVGFAGACATALLAYLGGVRSGKAQFITAASAAADLMLKQQSAVITRMEGVIQRQQEQISELQDEIGELRNEHGQCNAHLAELREQIALMRVAGQLPPYEFKAGG